MSQSITPITMLLLAILAFAHLAFPVVSTAALTDLDNPTHDHVNHIRYRATDLVGPPCCFAEDCTDWSLDASGHILSGTCYDKKDQRGHWDKVASTLDLSNCVGNFNGVLMGVSGGAYAKSCHDCTLDGTLLTCKCRKPTGEPGVDATVDLNAFVQDFNGHLKCFDYGGQ